MKFTTLFTSGLLVLLPLAVHAIPNPQQEGEDTTVAPGEATATEGGEGANTETFPQVTDPTGVDTGSVGIPESTLIGGTSAGTDTAIPTESGAETGSATIPESTLVSSVVSSVASSAPASSSRPASSTSSRASSSSSAPAASSSAPNAGFTNKADGFVLAGLFAGALAALV